MALLASLLFLALSPSLSVAQTTPSICGQPHAPGYPQTQAYSDCCTAFDGKTDTINGVEFKYHCESFFKLVPFSGKVTDPGTCALECSKNTKCKGALWDSTASFNQCRFWTISPQSKFLAMEIVPSSTSAPKDCTTEVATAVAAAQSADQVACQGQLAAANSACDTRVNGANSACDGRVTAEKTNCDNKINDIKKTIGGGCNPRRDTYSKQGKPITIYNACSVGAVGNVQFLTSYFKIDTFWKCHDLCESNPSCGTAVFQDVGYECFLYSGYAREGDLKPELSQDMIVLQRV